MHERLAWGVRRTLETDGGGKRRGGEFAAFFDGLEALRARVEDPLARKKRLDVDFAGLREDLTRHIARFELFRPLLWAFFQGLLRADARLLAEMLLTVLVESLPAANAAGGGGLDAACRFVSNGARELSDAGAPGVANRVVLNALARLDGTLGDELPADTTGGGASGGSDRLRTWPTLLHHLLGALPVDRDHQMLGYVRRVLERAVRASSDDEALRPVVAELWADLFDRALTSATPGSRSPALDHLLVRIDRLLAGPGAASLPATRHVAERLAALPRLKSWWTAYLERQPPGEDPTAGLPPSLRDLALLALRVGPPDETASHASRRLRALATAGGLPELSYLAAPLASESPLCRKAAVDALARLHERLGGGDAAVRETVVERLLPVLQDPETDVCRAAVRALGVVGAAELAEPLVALYGRSAEADQLLRAETLEALVAVVAAHPAARDRHTAVLRSEHDRHAVMARGRLRDRILAALEKLVS